MGIGMAVFSLHKPSSLFAALNRSSHPVAMEGADVLVVGVDQLPVSTPPAVPPHADVPAAGGGVRVRPPSVPDVVLPFTLILVTVDVVVLAETTPLVVRPAPCRQNYSADEACVPC